MPEQLKILFIVGLSIANWELAKWLWSAVSDAEVRQKELYFFTCPRCKMQVSSPDARFINREEKFHRCADLPPVS